MHYQDIKTEGRDRGKRGVFKGRFAEAGKGRTGKIAGKVLKQFIIACRKAGTKMYRWPVGHRYNPKPKKNKGGK